MHKKFILALSESRGRWTVNYYDDEAGPCCNPAEIAEISTEFENDDTIGRCKEIADETAAIFEKYGFVVSFDYESTVDRPILEITFPKDVKNEDRP